MEMIQHHPYTYGSSKFSPQAARGVPFDCGYRLLGSYPGRALGRRLSTLWPVPTFPRCHGWERGQTSKSQLASLEEELEQVAPSHQHGHRGRLFLAPAGNQLED